ncbi:MAG TPA: hypothetical protein VLJ59_01755 [Mycobacteriales bacterium]|nr:hypothetical protein [Mycobacteriales bacterium]
MKPVQAEAFVDDYLRRLDAAAWMLSPDRRTELATEIRDHIEAALRSAGSRDEVAVRNVLERLGRPEEIVAAAMETPPAAARAKPTATLRAGGLEVATIILFAVGWILYGIGTLVAMGLVWVSHRWTRRDKIVATALVGAPVILLVTQLLALLPFVLAPFAPILAVLGSIAAAIHLGVRASRLSQEDAAR